MLAVDGVAATEDTVTAPKIDVTPPEDDVVVVVVVAVVVVRGISGISNMAPKGPVTKDDLSNRRELLAGSNGWISIEKGALALHGSKKVS